MSSNSKGNNNFNRIYQRRDLLSRVYASQEERQYAVDRALELQSSLESRYPNFVKPMLQSHVTGGFWLVSLLDHFTEFVSFDWLYIAYKMLVRIFL